MNAVDASIPATPKVAPSPSDLLNRATLVPAFAASLTLGLAGHILIYPEQLGLGASVWGLCTLLVLALFQHGERPDSTRRSAGLYALAAFAALSLSWRDAPLLRSGNILLFLFAIAWIHLGSREVLFRRLGIGKFFSGLLLVAGTWIVLPVLHGRAMLEIAPRPSRATEKDILRALVITAGVLLVFGALLAQADARFAALFNVATYSDWESIAGHGFWVLFFTACALAILSNRVMTGKEFHTHGSQTDSDEKVDAGPSIGAIEAALPMAALDLMFGVFVYLQLGYLFGGDAYVQEKMGPSYAEYARHGFFELAAVAALVLSMQLLFDWLLRGSDAPGRRRFQWLARLQVVLLLFILASAAHRMVLYQEAYGLTPLRFYASAGIGWIGLTIIWHFATVLRNQRDRFILGAVVSAIAVFVVVQALNPDGMIARTQLERIAERSPVSEYGGRAGGLVGATRAELEFLNSLSRDAVPEISAALDAGFVAIDKSLIRGLNDRDLWIGPRRAWSWSRFQARRAVEQ